MQDALFEHPFANAVIQWGVGDPQKERQSGPVVEHVQHGFAHAGVGFNGVFRQLVFQPFFEVLHEGAVVFLVEGESFVGREHLCLREIIEMIDASEDVDDIFGLFGKGGDRVDKVAAGMSEAVCRERTLMEVSSLWRT